MQIVITMAGAGSRFYKAGYTVPKYQIVAHGQTLFAWSMRSLTGYGACRYFFLVRAEDNCADFIARECTALGIFDFTVIPVAHMTAGQAETAMLAAPMWDKNDSLLIYNIDTYVEPGCMTAQEVYGDGFIPCFCGEGDHWSFVRLGDGGAAVEVREKKRISPHCTVGAYYFSTCALYEDLYAARYGGDAADHAANLEAGEQYVAPLYNTLLERGGKIYISDIPAEKVHVLGTPEELHVFERDYRAH